MADHEQKELWIPLKVAAMNATLKCNTEKAEAWKKTDLKQKYANIVAETQQKIS